MKALLTDLDGVLRIWPEEPALRIEAQVGIPTGSIAEVVFDPELIRLAIEGVILDETWRDRIAERLGARFPHIDGTQVITAWSEPRGEINLPVLDLVRACRRVMPVVLVTNATTRLESDLRRLGLFGEFDSIVNSADVGRAKPDPFIFRVALEAAKVEAADALFIDDHQDNVTAALQLGIPAHLFRTADDLMSKLLSLRVPFPEAKF